MMAQTQNFFDVKDEFFIIDSKYLENTKTKLYGYSVQEDGIFEEENRTDKAMSNLNGCGVYVYIERINDSIIIYQDFNGSYGIYLYRSEEGEFVLSNSFFYLLKYLREQVRLSLNRDYANHILNVALASLAYSETMVNEIVMIPKNSIVHINTATRSLKLDYIDYGEDSLSLKTEAGIQNLDNWFRRWTKAFRKLRKSTNNITTSLSGGFDSRITFLLMLKSGVDLNGINIHSINDKLHTHEEDYKIASQIADKFNFGLNMRQLRSEGINYSLTDIINLSFYSKLTFHKEMYFRYKKFEYRRYMVAGAGGESVRAHWDESTQEFIDNNAKRAKRFSPKVGKELSESTSKILWTAYKKIRGKYQSENEEKFNFGTNIHREVRCRMHFGKSEVEDYFSNIYHLAPLMDPALRKIRLCEPECQDNNLLMAVIYVRYCPELLDFPFEGKREINEETIQFAKEINKRFPLNIMTLDEDLSDEVFTVTTVDYKVSTLLENNNPYIPIGVPDEYLKKAFDSTKFRKLFATSFDEELYQYAKSYYETRDYHPMAECYAVIGIVTVLKDIMVSEGMNDLNLAEEMQVFAESQFVSTTDIACDVFGRIKNYVTARIDLKFSADEDDVEFCGNGIDIAEVSDPSVKITKPKWLQDHGTGFALASYAGSIDITVRANAAGKLALMLRGMDIKDREERRIPFWIDYTKLQCNNMAIFEELRAAWHDMPVQYFCSVLENECVRFHIEWLPHIERGNLQDKVRQPIAGELPGIFEKVRNHITARVDTEFIPEESHMPCIEDAIEIIEMSDIDSRLTRPKWLQERGMGFVMTSYACSMDLTMKANAAGEIKIMLRGVDSRDKEGKRIPFWIDYTELRYNNMVIFNEPREAWHDKPLCYSYPVLVGELIRLHIEWAPHIDRKDKNGTRVQMYDESAVSVEGLNKRLDRLGAQVEQLVNLLINPVEQGDKKG
jgi:hypothetical protein